MKLTLTKAEHAYLVGVLASQGSWLPKVVKVEESLKSKLNGTDKPSMPAIGPMEALLVSKASGKVVKLASGSGYAAATKMCHRLGATESDMLAMSKWLGAQGWIQKASLTMLDVLRKWDTWLPKARQLYGDVGQETNKAGETAKGRRPTL